MTSHSTIPANHTKDTVLNFIKALNEEDMDDARKYINEDLSFVGVLGSRSGAETYLSDMARIKIKYSIEKIFVDGDDVCVLCDYIMGGVTVFGCGWYHLINGKISSIRAIFDPRPVLESSGKKQ